MISGGYYIKARCIENSWIAEAAPVVRETWDYLLREANHKEAKYSGYLVKRGQLFRSYKEIRDALKWKSGYRYMRYSGNQMKHTMGLLRKHGMIDLTGTPRGNLITVLNYDKYQSPENYGSTNGYTDGSTNGQPMVNHPSLPINKNDKNVINIDKKKNKEKSYTPVDKFEPSSRDELIAKDIAQELGEKNINFTLAAIKKHGVDSVQRAYGYVREHQNPQDRRKLFNSYVKSLENKTS